MTKKIISNYADLLIKVGVNLQKKEKLVISAPVIAADLVREIANKAYKNGAREVEVLWNDESLLRLDYKYRSMKSLAAVLEWAKMQRDGFIEDRVCYIVIASHDPEALKKVKTEKIATARRAKNLAFAKFRDYTSSNKIRWTIAAYPNKAWAKKVFPQDTASAAMKKLWNAIIASVRLDADNPMKAWEEHQNNLQRRCKILNGAKIKKLTYKNSIGTDFSVSMPKNYLFCGGAEEGALDGVMFTANMPTEEVFSSPERLSANGKLVSAMPLCRNGQIIDNFWIEFKNGKIIGYGAEKGYENLKSIIESDEGSHYLGEIALVGYSSPIRNQGVLFYETLFDENASCHFAIGDSYPNCVKNGGDMNEDELKDAGLNCSVEHVDFMVGTKDLSIVCETEDGKTFDVFKNGEWAI